MYNKQKLVKELKVARAKKDFTQKDLAEKSGVALITIGLIEAKNSTYKPSINICYKLASALEISPQNLIKWL